MLPKEERAVLLNPKSYFDFQRRGVLNRAVDAQKYLTSFLAYGYENYLNSAKAKIEEALEIIKELNENPKV